jgi:hypothetical protein
MIKRNEADERGGEIEQNSQSPRHFWFGDTSVKLFQIAQSLSLCHHHLFLSLSLFQPFKKKLCLLGDLPHSSWPVLLLQASSHMQSTLTTSAGTTPNSGENFVCHFRVLYS